MITQGQTIDRDTLNRAYVSKSATGTQIMAGSLRLLGGLQIDGTTTLAAITLTGALSAGANSITTTGTITAGTFSGSGASLTSLNGSNVSSGTVADARLSTNVMLLNAAQTVTNTKTSSVEQRFHLGTWTDPASGTSYAIKWAQGVAGDNLKLTGTLEVGGIATFDGNDYITFGSIGTGAPSDSSAGTKIKLYGNIHQIGIDDSTTWSESSKYHRFYSNNGTATRTLQLEIGDVNTNIYNNLVISKSLDIQGELKASTYNEFPDGLMISGGYGTWYARSNTTAVFDNTQTPPGTGAAGSLKITASSADSGAQSWFEFNVNPNEWVTFSAYAFATTASVQGQLYILFYDATDTMLTSPNWTGTYATGWTRYSVSAQAPSTASYCQVRIDVDTSGGIVYASAFQLERGRTLTGFKPYAGGKGMGLFDNGGIGGIIRPGNSGILFEDNDTIHIGDTPTSVLMQGKMTVTQASTFNALATFSSGITGSGNGLVRISTSNGYVDIGPQNSTWMHFITDRGRFYFDHPIVINGAVSSYSTNDLYLQTGDSGSGGTTRITVSQSTGNVGIGTGAHASYKLQVSGDLLLTSGWLRTKGSAGWYSEDYGGGWYMKDSTWIRSFNANKNVLVEGANQRLRVQGTLEVGAGETSTAASDLTVTASVFNYRNVLWSDGNHTAVRKTSSAHSLDVYTITGDEGINLQTGDNSIRVGLSFQNSNNAYSWYMGRANIDGTYADLIFYGGNNTSLGSLPEIFRLKSTTKAAKFQGNVYVSGANSTYNHDPSITLALGDGDTGFNWTADGSFNIMSNNVSVATITNANLNMNNHTITGVTTLSGQYGRIANSRSDEWLGINDDASHTSGVYFGSSTTRTDGQFQVGNNGADVKLSSSGIDVKQKFSMQYNSTEDSLDFVYIG
jgi:hypothetical protein